MTRYHLKNDNTAALKVTIITCYFYDMQVLYGAWPSGE